MKRRKYLASAVAITASAGCLGRIASGNSTDQHNMASDQNKMVSVVNARGNVEGLIVAVELVDDAITSDSTARLSLTYRNESTQAIKLQIQPDHPAPLHSRPVDEMPALLLFPDVFDPEKASPNCWKPTAAPAVRPVMTEYTLDPGHSVTMEYEVWASPKQDADCMQAKKYQIESSKASFELRVTQ